MRPCYSSFSPPGGPKGLVALVLRHVSSWSPLVVATTHTSVPLDRTGTFTPLRVLEEVEQSLSKLRDVLNRQPTKALTPLVSEGGPRAG